MIKLVFKFPISSKIINKKSGQQNQIPLHFYTQICTLIFAHSQEERIIFIKIFNLRFLMNQHDLECLEYDLQQEAPQTGTLKNG